MMSRLNMKTLNIVGAGRAGRTLAALWQQHGVFVVEGICNRTPQSTRDAMVFIGGGRERAAVRLMPPAEVWMLATPDGAIAQVAADVAASGALRTGDVVFHCSGALPSSDIRAVLAAGISIASVHPLKSFAQPADAMRNFAGTYCAAEGEAAALAVLKPAFEAIGAQVIEIHPQFKTLYHAASVMVCNYLVALMEAGFQGYEKAGLPRATAGAMIEPLVRETVDNVFKLGTVQALTGPIARGDHAVVARQLTALREFDPRIVEIYRALGVMALSLSREQHSASDKALAELEHLLQKN